MKSAWQSESRTYGLFRSTRSGRVALFAAVLANGERERRGGEPAVPVGAVEGGDSLVLERTIDVRIPSLRRKLAMHAPLIETVRGVGYPFRDPISAVEIEAEEPVLS